MHVRPMGEGDLEAVLDLQRQGYVAALQEGRDTFRQRLEAFPEGCLVLASEGRVVGYLFSHPWFQDRPLPLDHAMAAPPPEADAYYLHDLCVAPELRGEGAATALVNAALERAAACGLSALALVAVQGSEPFWARFGFEPRRTFDYAPGVPATAMVRLNPPRRPGAGPCPGSGDGRSSGCTPG